MELGINNAKDFAEVLTWIFGVAALIFTAYNYYLTRKQLNFTVIINCAERFQKIFPQLKSQNQDEKLKAVKLYVDLCNEELFYFKYKYLPDEIVDEWIDGMIFYLPHLLNDSNVNTDESYLREITDNNLLRDYPRTQKAFEVTREFDLSKYKDRKELVKIVKANLRKAKI